ncbi:MAG: hypothetical protein H7281_12665 [Bacteriovorax sp.]|nr:hypothetical protein [Bacteriovorax sp.]
MLKSLIVFFTVISSGHAADESGCLVRVGNSLKIDERCACLQSQSCAKLKTFKPDEAVLTQRDSNGRDLFNNNEKLKMRESFKVYDQIIKMRLAGKANSDEIKDLYRKLDKLNKEVRTSFLKTQAKYLEKSKTAYKKNLSQIREQKIVNLKLATDSLNNKVDMATLNFPPAEEKLAKPAKKEIERKESQSQAKAADVSEKVIEASKTEAEHEAILSSLKPEKLERKDNDSLFDIITKSYMRSAYPKLLKPTELPAANP